MLQFLAPVLGAIAGGAMNLFGAQQQNSANAASVQKQMDFQKEQRETQYQTAMEDMRKAGLNPMLAYQQGGAGTAAGAAYQSQNVGAAATEGAVSGSNSAIAARMMKSQIDNMSADTDLKKSNEKAANASVISSLAAAQLANANSATVAALRPYQVDKALWDAGVSSNVYESGQADVASARLIRDYLNSNPGKTARMLALGGKDAAEGTSALKNFSLFK